MIRLATVQDISNIKKGEILVFGKTLGDIIDEDIKSTYGKYFIIEDKSFIGYIGLRVLDQIEVMNFYILPEFQKNGYGNELLKYVSNYADELKLEIILEVRKSNYKAINLYKKYGFMEIREIRNYYKDESALILKRGVCKC